MKTKSLFFVAATALMVAGCSQNEVMETNPDANRAIGFGVYTGTQTKGLVTDNSLTDGTTANGLKVDGKGFGILAYQTSGNYSMEPKVHLWIMYILHGIPQAVVAVVVGNILH